MPLECLGTEAVDETVQSEEDEGEEPNPLSSVPAIPRYVAVKVWEEGTELSTSAGSICQSPGSNDASSWLVQSNNPSHRQPFFVQCRKSGQVLCEKGCALFNSCGVCAHCIAVAKFKGCLEQFISWLGKQRGSVNLSNLASTGMPKTSGKKPHSHRKSSKKSTTQRIKSILANASEKDHSPRIPVVQMSAAPSSVSSTQQFTAAPVFSVSSQPPSITTHFDFAPTMTIPEYSQCVESSAPYVTGTYA